MTLATHRKGGVGEGQLPRHVLPLRFHMHRHQLRPTKPARLDLLHEGVPARVTDHSAHLHASAAAMPI